MGSVSIALEVPIELGAVVLASSTVQASLQSHPEVRIRSHGDAPQFDGGYRDVGASTLMLLSAPAVVVSVKGVFSVIKTAIAEAHQTNREKGSQDHEFRKLVLVLNAQRNEIDLGQSMDDVRARIDALERAAIEACGNEQ